MASKNNTLIPFEVSLSFKEISEKETQSQSDELWEDDELETQSNSFLSDVNIKCNTIFPLLGQKIQANNEIPIDESKPETFLNLTIDFNYAQYIPYTWLIRLAGSYFSWKIMFREGDDNPALYRKQEYDDLLDKFKSMYVDNGTIPPEHLNPDNQNHKLEFDIDSPYLHYSSEEEW